MDAFTGTQLASDPFGETFAVAGRGGREVRFRRLASAFAGRDGFAELLLARRDPILALTHRNLVTTVAIARDGKGRLIVAEGLPSGPSLAACLTAVVASGRPLGREPALHIARAVVSGLAHLHAAGLVHGLIHPRSVYLDATGAVRLGDIAVAKAVAVTAGEAPELRAVTSDELAPEDSAPPVDTRLDIYRTGALVRLLLSAADVVPVGELAAVIERATASDPRERHADAAELLVHLDEASRPADDAAAVEREMAELVADAHTAGLLEEAPSIGGEAAEIANDVTTDALASGSDDSGAWSAARPAAVTVERASVPPPRVRARLRSVPRLPLLLVAAESIIAVCLLVGLMSDPAPPPRHAAAAPSASIPSAPLPIESPAVPATPPPAPVASGCVLNVRSTPPAASVVIDGQSAGVTPVTVMGVACDRAVAVTVDKVGFEPQRKQVTLATGVPFHLQASLERPRVMLRLVSNPPGAQVAINRKPVGETPLAIELDAVAEADVLLQKKGYRSYRAKLVPSVQRELVAQLVPLRRPVTTRRSAAGAKK